VAKRCILEQKLLLTASVVVLEESPCPLVLEDPRGPIFKSLSLSSSSEVQVLENFRGLSRLT